MIAALLSDLGGIFTFKGFEGCGKDVCHLLPTAIVEFGERTQCTGQVFRVLYKIHIYTYNN